MWELSVLPTNNTMFPARDRTRTARSGDERTRLLRFKSGGIRWFKWNFRKSKERLKEKNSGTPSESSTPPKGHPGLVGNCLVYVYQFLTSNSKFKTSNRQNFQLIPINFTYPYIPKQKRPKRRYVGWAERLIAWNVNEIFLRSINRNTQPKCGFQVYPRPPISARR